MTTASSCTERARTRRRGAALVESVIVVSTLAMCMVALIGVRSLYLAKIQAGASARDQALTQAMEGCGIRETGIEGAKTALRTLAHQLVDFDFGDLARVVFGGAANVEKASTGQAQTAHFQRSTRHSVTVTDVPGNRVTMPCVVKPTECCANIDFYSLIGLDDDEGDDGDNEGGGGSW